MTNHVGSLVLLAGAPGCPTGRNTGKHRWSSLQHRLVHGIGRLTIAPLGWIQQPIESTQPEDIPGEPKTNKRIKAKKQSSPSERKNWASTQGQRKTAFTGRGETAVLSHLSGSQKCCVSVSPFSVKTNQTKLTRKQTFVQPTDSPFICA